MTTRNVVPTGLKTRFPTFKSYYYLFFRRFIWLFSVLTCFYGCSGASGYPKPLARFATPTAVYCSAVFRFSRYSSCCLFRLQVVKVLTFEEYDIKAIAISEEKLPTTQICGRSTFTEYLSSLLVA